MEGGKRSRLPYKGTVYYVWRIKSEVLGGIDLYWAL